MPLHPSVAEFLASLPEHDPAAPESAPIDPAARRAEERSHVPPPDRREPHVAEIADRIAHTPSGDVPVRVYRTGGTGGVLVYFHGGAFFLGSLDTHDRIARELAVATGLTVVSVGYRLAPENAFPAGLDDCAAVVRWVTEDSGIGWDATTLALVGDSSGGTFATAVAARLHDEGFHHVTHQVLYYPSVDLDFDESRYASLRENATGYGLETWMLAPDNRFYLDSGADPDDPSVSPIKRRDLSGLPPALVVTAEFDPLRDEGEAYGARLRDAGVPTTIRRVPGAGHGFVQHFGWVPEFHTVYAQTASFIGDNP